MLALGYVQAFSLNWALFKLAKNISHIFSLDWAFFKKCPIKWKCLRIPVICEKRIQKRDVKKIQKKTQKKDVKKRWQKRCGKK